MCTHELTFTQRDTVQAGRCVVLQEASEAWRSRRHWEGGGRSPSHRG